MQLTPTDARSAALVDGLASALATVSRARKLDWPDQHTGQLTRHPKATCPTLHQILSLRYAMGHDPTEEEKVLRNLATEYADALRLSKICKVAHERSLCVDKSVDFHLGPFAALKEYTTKVRREDGVKAASTLRDELHSAVSAACTEWLLSVWNEIAHWVSLHCPSVDRGCGVNRRLVDELARRLAARAVDPPAVPDSAPSPSSAPLVGGGFEIASLRSLAEAHVEQDMDMAACATEMARDGLQWLVELCDSTSDVQIDRCTEKVALAQLRYLCSKRGFPTELKTALGDRREAIDALASICAYEQPPVRKMALLDWRARYGRLVGNSSRRALIAMNRSSLPRGASAFASGPVLQKWDPSSCAARSSAQRGAAVLSSPRHVLSTTTYALLTPKTLEPCTRTGMTASSIVSLFLVDAVSELIHHHGEIPPLRVNARIASRAFEASKHKSLYALDLILFDLSHGGRFVTHVLDSMRDEITLDVDSDMSDDVAAASHALRHFHLQDVVRFLSTKNADTLVTNVDLLTSSMRTRLGERPVYSLDIPPEVLSASGMLSDHSAASMPRPRLISTDQSATRVYYPTLVFDLLGVAVPAIAAFRRRMDFCRTVGMDPSTRCCAPTSPPNGLLSGMLLTTELRSHVVDLLRNDRAESLHLTSAQYRLLPAETRSLLDSHLPSNGFVEMRSCLDGVRRRPLVEWTKTRRETASGSASSGRRWLLRVSASLLRSR